MDLIFVQTSSRFGFFDLASFLLDNFFFFVNFFNVMNFFNIGGGNSLSGLNHNVLHSGFLFGNIDLETSVRKSSSSLTIDVDWSVFFLVNNVANTAAAAKNED
jgi:hypothetical protein